MSRRPLTIEAYLAACRQVDAIPTGPAHFVRQRMRLPHVPPVDRAAVRREGRLREGVFASLTREERERVELLRERGRVRRIAAGSGCPARTVRELLGQWECAYRISVKYSKLSWWKWLRFALTFDIID